MGVPNAINRHYGRYRRFTIVIRKVMLRNNSISSVRRCRRITSGDDSRGELIRQVVFPDIDKDHRFYECAKSGEKLATVFPDGGSIQVRPADASCKH